MGYNTAFLMVENVTPAETDDLLNAHFDAADLFSTAGEEIGFEAASSQALHPNIALGVVGAWAVFWNPNGRLAGPEFACAISRGRRALAGALDSGDSRYGFSYFVDGALRRAIVFQGNVVEKEQGTPLPEESGLNAPAWGPDEDFVFALMARLTEVTFDDLAMTNYRLMEFLG